MRQMLHKIGSHLYNRVRSLFVPINYNLAIDSILSGLTPGPIYVDDIIEPQLALTWTRSRIFLAGKAPNEAVLTALRHTLLDKFYPECALPGPGFFTINYTLGRQEDIEDVLASQNVMRDVRHYYQLDARKFARQGDLPPGYSAAPIDAALLANTNLVNLDGMLDEMQSERPSVDDFLKKSFGFCIIHDGAIVAYCMSEYNYNDRCEIGIFTAESHRRRGLAMATATAVIGHAAANGISKIGWHCWRDNEPSNAAAVKLGFVLRVQAPVLFGYSDPLQNLAANGSMSLREGNAQQAMQWFAEAAKLGELPLWTVPYRQRAQELIDKGETSV